MRLWVDCARTDAALVVTSAMQGITYRMRRWAACARSDAAQVINCAQGGMTGVASSAHSDACRKGGGCQWEAAVAYRKATTASVVRALVNVFIGPFLIY
ncbi:hypothetical protein BHM03_00031802 [Ensete ventricosum]|nr:hypothetical protein BHM03_00031802 [Ensete ventricosum]